VAHPLRPPLLPLLYRAKVGRAEHRILQSADQHEYEACARNPLAARDGLDPRGHRFDPPNFVEIPEGGANRTRVEAVGHGRRTASRCESPGGIADLRRSGRPPTVRLMSLGQVKLPRSAESATASAWGMSHGRRAARCRRDYKFCTASDRSVEYWIPACAGNDSPADPRLVRAPLRVNKCWPRSPASSLPADGSHVHHSSASERSACADPDRSGRHSQSIPAKSIGSINQ